MKVKLTQRNRIDGEAGEIVEVSPSRAVFLLTYCGAEPVVETREKVETPEKAVKKTTRRKANT